MVNIEEIIEFSPAALSTVHLLALVHARLQVDVLLVWVHVHEHQLLASCVVRPEWRQQLLLCLTRIPETALS